MDSRVLGAFIEYVLRPITQDIRGILDRLQELNLIITERTIRRVTIGLGILYLGRELIRFITYLGVTWILGHVALRVLLAYQS